MSNISLYFLYPMPFNPEEIIDTFLNLDSIPQEAKDKLSTLRDGLKWVAPELIQERIFYNFKSQQSLPSILQEHASGNQQALALYNKMIVNLNK